MGLMLGRVGDDGTRDGLPGGDWWRDFPTRRWRAPTRVDASGEAYFYLLTPDAALALADYGVLLALIGMGAADRAQTRPMVPLLAATKLALDAAGAAHLTVEQVSRAPRDPRLVPGGGRRLDRRRAGGDPGSGPRQRCCGGMTSVGLAAVSAERAAGR